jgi:hypothetical protein
MFRTLSLAAVALVLIGCGSKTNIKPIQDLVDEVTVPTQKAFAAWDPKPLNDHFTQGPGRDEAKADDDKAMRAAQAKYGKLISLGKGELKSRDGSDTSNNPMSTPLVRYEEAKFEKGPAVVEVWIRAKRDTLEWTVDHYKVFDKTP